MIKIMTPLANVDSEAAYALGTRGHDNSGNEYIYLKGITSTAIGSWVTFDEAHLTTLAVADAQGRVAIAIGAVIDDKYGWYQIYGSASGLALTAFADNGKVYLTSTDGSVDDADASADFILGAVGRSAVNETSMLATFELNYPMVLDLVMD